jgi:hypothetical protein
LPSPVLQAMGVADDVLRSAMRFSLSFLLGEAELDEAARRRRRRGGAAAGDRGVTFRKVSVRRQAPRDGSAGW